MSEIGRQTYEIMHRLSNDLGLIPSSLRKIRTVLDEIGLRQPRIDHELDRVLADIKGVLSFSKDLTEVLSRPTQREPEVCEIGPLIEGVVGGLNTDDRAVDVVLRVEESTGSVRGDCRQIADALLNLLTNAVEAMPEGGRLSIEADGNDAMVTIRISDFGRGIREKQLERIFDLGYTTKPGGSGFGLWSVKRTVSNHGGEIEVVSEPGKGTTFTVDLARATYVPTATEVCSRYEVDPPPSEITEHSSMGAPVAISTTERAEDEPAVSPTPSHHHPRVSSSAQGRPRRILIVEDLPRWRETIGESLKGDEFEVETAASKLEAEEKIARKSYDLIILDLRLEDLDSNDSGGIEILRGWPADRERPRVIILSAFGSSDLIREAFLEHGVNEFISKQNFDKGELRDGVRRLFEEGLAENRDLEILWDGFNAMEAVAALRLGGIPLADADKQAVAGELEGLLCRLFNRAQSIIVRRLHPGWSGAGVLRVEAFSEARGRPLIVKFGDGRQIERERSNFLEVAKPYLGSRSAMVEEFRKSGRLGGIVYSRVGATDTFRSFAELYQGSDSDALKAVLEKLFRVICGPWYESPGRVRPLDLRTYYAEWLSFNPESLERNIARLGLVDVKSKIFFENLTSGRSYRNPLRFLADGPFIYPTYQTLTHGDFNAHNILVDEYGDPWLIDFARSGRGHVLRDAVELDSVIRHELLSADDASLDERLLLEAALCEAGSYRELREPRESPVPQNPAVSKAFAVCRELRWIAGGLGARQTRRDIREFYAGAILCALNCLRFSDYSTVQREHALLSACVMMERLSGGKSGVEASA